MAPLFASLSGSVTSLQQSTPLSTNPTDALAASAVDGEEGVETEEGAVAGVAAAGGAVSSERPKDKDKVYCAASKLSRLLFVLGQVGDSPLRYRIYIPSLTFKCIICPIPHPTSVYNLHLLSPPPPPFFRRLSSTAIIGLLLLLLLLILYKTGGVVYVGLHRKARRRCQESL